MDELASRRHDRRQQKDLKAVALAAAARGWHVFPLRPGTTEPAVRDWAERATTNTWRIVRCWDSGPFNVGIVPCASGLLVLDLVPAGAGEQPPEPYRLPGVHGGTDVLAVLLEEWRARLPCETYSVDGPGGRMQYYFAHPDDACPPAAPGPLAWHVEVRCTGSYVPAAGCVTPDGAYTVGHDAALAEAPGWLTVPAGFDPDR
ncbi:bifunctional DNA primase/polymerase (plasmid) [Streptomyces sp. NA02950]|uniref:bifunctional DNA primase/polymerase n=1 Tax=Streptomyces sp. NA02950 TaxID=2742137 RepID=UPI00158FD025|nr:bifunctional DNA primase/polymerase [Streptomyces sp. NA02950]QKV98335.1 bifunctional DNA primase/polymerase [Streptomyces sp. NA02950]